MKGREKMTQMLGYCKVCNRAIFTDLEGYGVYYQYEKTKYYCSKKCYESKKTTKKKGGNKNAKNL